MKIDLLEIAKELNSQGITYLDIDSDKISNEVLFILSSKYELFNKLYSELIAIDEQSSKGE
jgi:hypothetical protein